MELASTFGTISLCTKVSGLKTKYMGPDSTCGQTADNTRVSGRIITCTVGVFIPGKTGESMRASIRTTESMVMASILGPIIGSTLVTGRMESNMEKGFTD
jgi:hypothetical protein